MAKPNETIKPEENPQFGASALNTVLDCPFCGLPAVVKKEKSFSGWIGWRIECGSVSDMECYIQPSTAICRRKKDALNEWNSRAI